MSKTLPDESPTAGYARSIRHDGTRNRGMTTDVLAARNVEIVHRGQRDTVDVLGIWCEWKTTGDETNHHYSVMEMILSLRSAKSYDVYEAESVGTA